MTIDSRPPESTGLLERFMADLLADDYPEAATEPVRPFVRRSRAALALVAAGMIGVILVAALISTRLSTGEQQQTRSELVDRVSTLTAALTSEQAVVDEKARAVQLVQDRLLAATDAGPAQALQIASLAVQSGTTGISGPGVVVTLDDAPDAASGSLNRVLDRDLQDIVNVLWREGAEGIAINGQRLTGDSAIRSAGEAILVNYQPLERPYAVSAVGATTSGNEDSSVHRLLVQLSDDYGLVSEVRTSDVALPAGELRSPRFAQPTSGGVAPS